MLGPKLIQILKCIPKNVLSTVEIMANLSKERLKQQHASFKTSPNLFLSRPDKKGRTKFR